MATKKEEKDPHRVTWPGDPENEKEFQARLERENAAHEAEAKRRAEESAARQKTGTASTTTPKNEE
jgi:hypothetical protein